MLLVTGPNMGGKSTFMRQCALIALLAHTGCHVPAESARIGPIDRIFTRIGAADDLARGQSTFMVEMTESAHILRNASAESLVLMDEVGRGTSTWDGLALAWACAEHLALVNRALCLFATHYFELTALETRHASVSNVHLDAVEHDGRIVFMHAIKRGATNRSYGLQVAELAGLPRVALDSARERLAALERGDEGLDGGGARAGAAGTRTDEAGVIDGDDDRKEGGAVRDEGDESRPAQAIARTAVSRAGASTRRAATKRPATPQLELFGEADALARYLAELDLDGLTPREALSHLYRLAELADGEPAGAPAGVPADAS